MEPCEASSRLEGSNGTQQHALVLTQVPAVPVPQIRPRQHGRHLQAGSTNEQQPGRRAALHTPSQHSLASNSCCCALALCSYTGGSAGSLVSSSCSGQHRWSRARHVMKRRCVWRVAEPPRAAAPSGSQLQRPAHLEPAQQLLAGRQVALAEGPLSQGRRGDGLLTIDGSAGAWLAGSQPNRSTPPPPVAVPALRSLPRGLPSARALRAGPAASRAMWVCRRCGRVA